MPKLGQYKKEMEDQLESILSWWMRLTPDPKNGGFYGKIDHANTIYPEAPKGSVLNSRILWSFSSAYQLTNNSAYLEIAERAFSYLADHFLDKEYGGIYWSVDYKGGPQEDKKQIYALGFAVYALSEFYRCSQNNDALQTAIEIYNDIISHSYDEWKGGYIEALTREWSPLHDLRLSTKDQNERKSMNTHLHLLEAFTNLYRILKNEALRLRLVELIRIFRDHIVDKESGHLGLFFDDDWNSKSSIISFGHDIEAAWLLLEAAEIAGEPSLITEVKDLSIMLTDAAREGLDTDGGLWYEYDLCNQRLVKEKHSWPQAEAIIGFFNAWQITEKKEYFNQSLSSWHFVKNFILDHSLGEWYWGVYEDHSPMIGEEKAGIWKCPYHNSRACMEIIRRMDEG